MTIKAKFYSGVGVFLLASLMTVSAQQFRQFEAIGKPAHAPAGAKVIENPKPVARDTVEKAVSGLLANWNRADTESILADDFYDRSRLADVVDEKVPRDASLRLLSIQGSQTLEQYQLNKDGMNILSSVVSVTANTQLEFNDPARGFRRLNGVNEYILRIEEEILGAKP